MKLENIKKEKMNRGGEEEEEEEAESNEREHEHSGQKEKANSALIPPKRGKLKLKAKVKEETLDVPQSPTNEDKALKDKGGKKKKKKVVKVKRKNKINTEEMSGPYSQPMDLSATLDLYRKAVLALKERQDQER
ncbi:hypothetical protein LDENG_00249170 [Lucifuga dentata]|nr:hypothetical protein LDENG_00249170 [Lucifuga dentata]